MSGGPSVAICPGSFDPLTNGHVDLVLRSAALFDRVVVTVMVNTGKRTLFTIDERVGLARTVFGSQASIEVDAFDGLLVDYARRRGARAIVRGLRSGIDLEYERPMVLMNRRMAPGVDTVFLLPGPEVAHISSTLVREIVQLGGDAGPFVPAVVLDRWRAKLEGR